MSLSVSELQRRVEAMASQQEIMFTFIEKGLTHLSKQLAAISKNNHVNEEVIHHLQAVVRDSFKQINKQEEEIADLHAKQSQVGDWMLDICRTLDEKTKYIKELEIQMMTCQLNSSYSPPIDEWFPVANQQTPTHFVPASPCLQPNLAPIWEFDPFIL